MLHPHPRVRACVCVYGYQELEREKTEEAEELRKELEEKQSTLAEKDKAAEQTFAQLEELRKKEKAAEAVAQKAAEEKRKLDERMKLELAQEKERAEVCSAHVPYIASLAATVPSSPPHHPLARPRKGRACGGVQRRKDAGSSCPIRTFPLLPLCHPPLLTTPWPLLPSASLCFPREQVQRRKDAELMFRLAEELRPVRDFCVKEEEEGVCTFWFANADRIRTWDVKSQPSLPVHQILMRDSGFLVQKIINKRQVRSPAYGVLMLSRACMPIMYHS